MVKPCILLREAVDEAITDTDRRIFSQSESGSGFLLSVTHASHLCRRQLDNKSSEPDRTVRQCERAFVCVHCILGRFYVVCLKSRDLQPIVLSMMRCFFCLSTPFLKDNLFPSSLLNFRPSFIIMISQQLITNGFNSLNFLALNICKHLYIALTFCIKIKKKYRIKIESSSFRQQSRRLCHSWQPTPPHAHYNCYHVNKMWSALASHCA